MQIEILQETALTAKDDVAIGRLLDAAFGEIGEFGFNGRSYYKQRHHMRVLARHSDQVIGHIALTYRVVTLGNDTFPIIGLAEVATHLDHGGKGIASALLQEAIKAAMTTQAEFILLFGSHPIYTRRGFQSAQNELRYVGIDEGHINTVFTRVDEDLKIMPLRDRLWDATAKLDLLGHLF